MAAALLTVFKRRRWSAVVLAAALIGCLLSYQNLTAGLAKPFDQVLFKTARSVTDDHVYDSNDIKPDTFGEQLRDHANAETEQEYLTWSEGKKQSIPETCPGWQNYKNYIEALFHLAPPISNCANLDTFVERYANASINRPGNIVLQRRASYTFKGNATQDSSKRSIINPNQAFYLDRPSIKRLEGGRDSWVQDMWRKVHAERNLPRFQSGTLKSLDMILYSNDKPRVFSNLGLPPFVFSGQFVPSSNPRPDQWHGHLPFPSHLYRREAPSAETTIDTITPNVTFDQKRPVLFYRGRFSEVNWKRVDIEAQRKSVEATPRFQLANASKLPQDQDVLDVQMTGFAVGNGEMQARFREILLKDHNITVIGKVPGTITDSSQYVLAVSGNGWAGNTMMRSIMSGACTIFIKDTSVDYERITRDLGEVYFPLLKPGKHIVEVTDYYDVANTVRRLNKDKKFVRRIAEAGLEFSKQHLGPNCALDIIELLVWNYYRYITTGCPDAFTDFQEATQ